MTNHAEERLRRVLRENSGKYTIDSDLNVTVSEDAIKAAILKFYTTYSRLFTPAGGGVNNTRSA